MKKRTIIEIFNLFQEIHFRNCSLKTFILNYFSLYIYIEKQNLYRIII